MLDVCWALALAASSEPLRTSRSAAAIVDSGVPVASLMLRGFVRKSSLMAMLARTADPADCTRAQLVDTIWAFKTSAHPSAPALLERALPAVHAAAAAMAPHELACVLYAYAAVGVPGAVGLFRSLAPQPPTSPTRGRAARGRTSAELQAEAEAYAQQVLLLLLLLLFILFIYSCACARQRLLGG
ncbi:hypothetical protein T492DRAFT_364157 [Pavlovales sp. CCMP2436]|nr:hypothetical protein T492DRAFT_364157 [Pavlovales sp. CCMP2436]